MDNPNILISRDNTIQHTLAFKKKKKAFSAFHFKDSRKSLCECRYLFHAKQCKNYFNKSTICRSSSYTPVQGLFEMSWVVPQSVLCPTTGKVFQKTTQKQPSPLRKKRVRSGTLLNLAAQERPFSDESINPTKQTLVQKGLSSATLDATNMKKLSTNRNKSNHVNKTRTNSQHQSS